MSDTTTTTFVLSNRTYEFLKNFVQVYLPAFSALYFGLAAVWGLPYSEEIVGTCAVIAVFLGSCLRISSKQYHESDSAYDGNVVITQKPDGGKMISLEVNGDPDEIEKKKSIRFLVAPREQ